MPFGELVARLPAIFFRLAGGRDGRELVTWMAASVGLLLVLGWCVQADTTEIDNVVTLLEIVLDADEATAVACLEKLSVQAQSGQLNRGQLAALRMRLSTRFEPIRRRNTDQPLDHAVLTLSAQWGDEKALRDLRAVAWDRQRDEPRRMAACDTLAAMQDQIFLSQCGTELGRGLDSPEFIGRLLDAFGRFEQPEAGELVLQQYDRLNESLRAKAIGLLTQRPLWSKRLLAATARGDLPARLINVNQMRALLSSRDPEVAAEAKRQFGTVRVERDPQREQLVREIRESLARTPGDAAQGQAIFHRVCGQCHKIHGMGQEVGPDVTSNGRSSYDQLLSNVFDPSLVIGPAYQAVTVVTADGRVLTGLVAEDNDRRIILKVQGGKVEIVPRSEIDTVTQSQLSLMPEGLERQLNQQELSDLFAFLSLDRPPGDPAARPIPGTPSHR